MIDLKRYQALKLKVEGLEKEKNKNEGALEQLREQLKKDFNCSTLKEAKKTLSKLEDELQELESKFEKTLETFEGEYDEL